MGLYLDRYSDWSDEELVLQAGHEGKALAELYRRYGPRLLHYFYRMLGRDEEKARDFLHDLFVKIIEKGQSFSPEGRFSTWVFALAHHMCCNEYRRLEVRREHRLAFEDCATASCNPSYHPVERAVDEQAFRAALLKELTALDDPRRSAFLLRFQEGFSISEIARIQDCPEGTVKSRLFYAVRYLAEHLGPFDPGAPDQ